MEFSDEERIQEKGVEGSSVQAEEAMLSDQNKTTLLRGSTKTQDLDEQCCVIHISQKFKISIKKHLIPLRIALFCWYGAGSPPLKYLSVFMKQKGLSLVEYSSILSVTFVFQFLTAFLSGIVADKIGNAKPVLVFHVVVTMLMILTFLLIPDINTCENHHNNDTQSYDENSVEYIAGQKKDIIDKTLERDLVNVSQFNKTNILNYENFPKYSLPNVINFVGGDDKENFTAVNIRNIPSRSAGAFTGGMILNAVGYRVACRIFAGASLATAVLYASFLYCRRRRTHRMIKTNISCNLGEKSITPVEEALFL